MLLERNQVVVGLVFALIVLAGSVFAVGFSGTLFESGYQVTIELANSEGLQSGDDIMVAGMRAGKVQSVEIEGGHISVTALVRTEVPTDSTARIVLRNFVGKRGIQIATGSEWDSLLEDQQDPRIPLARTETLVDFPDLGDETVALLRDSDVQSLETLVTALADITEGQRDEVGRLLEGLRDVSAVLADRRDALATLIQRAEVLASAAADKGEDITTIIDEFGSTLDELSANRDDLRVLLEETALATSATADLVGSERERLDRILDEVHEVLTIADEHQVDIAHTFAYGGVAFYGFSQVGRSGAGDTPYWGNILTTGVGDAGIDAFAGCGGAVDQFLDQIFGPAECPDEGDTSGGPEEGQTSGQSGTGQSGSGQPGTEDVAPLGSIRDLFGGGS